MPVKVKRIVANIAAEQPRDVAAFYEAIFGLQLVMDLDWIRTYSSGEQAQVQLSVASEGGSGAPVPNLSIEVEDVEAVLANVRRADIEVVYGPVTEPWGVRRFYIRDPLGTLINVLQHSGD